MDSSIYLTVILCFGMGLSLGLFGGGGSILTVPIFVYTAHYSVNDSIALSLVTVGVASMLASIRYIVLGLVNVRLVIIFFLTGTAASFAGAHFTSVFSDAVLLMMFGVLMSLVGGFLYFKAEQTGREMAVDPVCRPRLFISLTVGAVIGFLTGFLGVGGGFLIVPAIALLMRCSLQTAIGTSLVIIVFNSIAGYWGHMTLDAIPLKPTAYFVFAAALGSFTGSRLGLNLKSKLLQRLFAGVITILGIFLILSKGI